MQQPLVAKKVKTFGLISKRTMMIDATVPLGGYVPGQTINLQINVNNQSKETVSKFSVKLVKVRNEFLRPFFGIFNVHFILECYILCNASLEQAAQDGKNDYQSTGCNWL